jgi:hypothetical protein
MKKFLINLLRYTAIMAVTVTVTFLVAVPQFSNNFNASILSKIQRLESIQEPKIVLVGNSSLALGMDSAALEEAMGMPVVNLGLHGGLGNMFLYKMAEGNISRGDIVVLANTHFDSGRIQDPALAWITIENRRDFWKFIPEECQTEMILAFPDYVLSTLRAFGGYNKGASNAIGPYTRYPFNEYGDNIWPREETQMEFGYGTVTVPEVTDAGVDQINAFAAYCAEQGAACLLAGYPIPYGEFSPGEEEFAALRQTLEERLDCQLISDYSDYFLDYGYFFDTQYHLTTEGASLRTQLLIADLQRWLETQS